MTAMSESMVEYELAKQGWFVFKQTTGKAPFDVVAYKDGRTVRVSIKATQSSLQIDLRRIRSNRSGITVHHFDATSCDVIACYLHEHKTVAFVAAESVKGQDVIVFALQTSKYVRKDRTQRLLHDFLLMPIITETIPSV